MTKNRARVRAAKELAQTSGIRHPEASYLADNRKLLLHLDDERSIYDFSAGPLRLHGDGNLGAALSVVKNDALRKGWRILFVKDLSVPAPSIADLKESPALVVVDVREPYDANSIDSSVVRLIEGTHLDINVLVGLHGDDTLPAGLETGRNSRINVTDRPRASAGKPRLSCYSDPETYRNDPDHATTRAADDALNFMGIPVAAQKFARASSGLFLITGRTGSGKTMTGISLLRRAYFDKMPKTYAIVDIHERGMVALSGAEVIPVLHPANTGTYIRRAIKNGARILFVDGLYNADSIEAALDAALSGVLVIATMHAQASEAAQQLLDAFPDGGRAKTRAKVQLALRGVISQTLVRGESSTSRVLASEVWAEGADGELAPVLTFQDSLAAPVAEGTVLQSEADRVAARGR